MSAADVKPGDRVRITAEGKVIDGALVCLDNGSCVFLDGVDVEVIRPPAPTEPGTVLWFNRNDFIVLGTDGRWRWDNGVHFEAGLWWGAGRLSTERPDA